MISNISVPSLPAAAGTAYFFPDRVLMYHSGGVSALAYGQLVPEIREVQFVEASEVPQDSQLVGKAWKYVNRDGGPDRRFRDNRELPVAIYGELRLAWPHFTIVAQCSNPAVLPPLAETLKQLPRGQAGFSAASTAQHEPDHGSWTVFAEHPADSLRSVLSEILRELNPDVGPKVLADRLGQPEILVASGLSLQDANTLMLRLDRHGIPCRKDRSRPADG